MTDISPTDLTVSTSGNVLIDALENGKNGSVLSKELKSNGSEFIHGVGGLNSYKDDPKIEDLERKCLVENDHEKEKNLRKEIHVNDNGLDTEKDVSSDHITLYVEGETRPSKGLLGNEDQEPDTKEENHQEQDTKEENHQELTSNTRNEKESTEAENAQKVTEISVEEKFYPRLSSKANEETSHEEDQNNIDCTQNTKPPQQVGDKNVVGFYNEGYEPDEGEPTNANVKAEAQNGKLVFEKEGLKALQGARIKKDPDEKLTFEDNLCLPKANQFAGSTESSLQDSECDLCNPMFQKNRTLSANPSLCERFKYAISCPPHGSVGEILTWIMVIPFIWGVLIVITGNEALPGGNLFSIMALLLLAQIGGHFISKLHLPPLLGMLLVGIALRSIPGLDVIGGNIDQKWSATLRKTALVIILTRAGLGLDPVALRQMSFMVLRLGIIPNLVEMAVVTVVTHFLLNFPWLWGILIGFIISGVSPSVVVPCMLSLSDSGYGVEKGVPTLVIAGLSVDNVLSISGFGVMLGIIFAKGSLVWQIFKGPIEVIIGLVYAIVMGILLWYLPNKCQKGFTKFRFVLLFCSGLLALFGSGMIDFGGAGPIGCLGAAFVAGIGWRKQGNLDGKKSVKTVFNYLWLFFLPLLFGLIGTEIKISALNGSTVGYGIATLAISVSFRVVTSFFAVYGGSLTLKERLFVAISWLPKATIQAAFGSLALDTARAMDGNDDVDTPEEVLGKQVLTIAVLVIIVAAPIGATAIMLSAPKLLKRKIYNKVSTAEGEEPQTA